jgi:hypothetical protein
MIRSIFRVALALLACLGIFACSASSDPGPAPDQSTSEALTAPAVFKCGAGVCTVGVQVCCDLPDDEGACEPRCVSGHVCPLPACKAPGVKCGTDICARGQICCAGMPFRVPTCWSGKICPI